MLAAGQLEAAEGFCRELLSQGDFNLEASLTLATACSLSDRLEEAIAILQQVVVDCPEHEPSRAALTMLAVSMSRQDALDAVLKVNLLGPEGPATLRAIAEQYRSFGHFADAASLCKSCLRWDPCDDEAIILLAHIHETASDYDSTVRFCQTFLQNSPGSFEAAYQLGYALLRLGRADEALECLLSAVGIRPGSLKTLRAIGYALLAMNQCEAAIDVFRQAFNLDQKNTTILQPLATCYGNLGMYDEGIECLESALAIVPDDDALQCILGIFYQNLGEIEKSMNALHALIQRSPDFLDAYQGQLFNYSIAPLELRSNMLSLAKRYWRLIQGAHPPRPIAEAFPASSDSSAHDADEDEHACYRIGVLSADFGAHVVSTFLRPFLREYDRDLFFIELISTSRRYEDKAEELCELADGSLTVQGLSLEMARSLVRERRYDLIIETSGLTADFGLRIISERCAPVQCHYIGYHASTGLSTIDYFIGDSITANAHFASRFSEKLLRLPRLWLAHDPAESFPPTASLSSHPGLILGSFNQVAKIGVDTLKFWAAALVAVPEALLVIKDRGAMNHSLQQRICAFLSDQNIDPSRLHFYPHLASREEHLNAYNAIDVALDTTPWSSSTTGFEALAMGVPLIAIRGSCTSARMSTSIVSALGKPEWVASTPEEYALIVKSMGVDYEKIRAGKDALQRAVFESELFDSRSLSAALSGALLSVLKTAPSCPGSNSAGRRARD